MVDSSILCWRKRSKEDASKHWFHVSVDGALDHIRAFEGERAELLKALGELPLMSQTLQLENDTLRAENARLKERNGATAGRKQPNKKESPDVPAVPKQTSSPVQKSEHCPSMFRSCFDRSFSGRLSRIAESTSPPHFGGPVICLVNHGRL